MTTHPAKFNLSTKATANGRISGMSNRSPLNKTIDGFLHIGSVEEILDLKKAIEAKIQEAEASRTLALKRFNRTNTRNHANALRNSDINLAALMAAHKRIG